MRGEKKLLAGLICGVLMLPSRPMSMEARPQTEEHCTERSGLSWYVWMIMFVPLVYFLSVGPALKLRDAHVLPKSVYGVIYGPLGYGMRACPALSRSVNWYVYTLWRWRPRCIY